MSDNLVKLVENLRPFLKADPDWAVYTLEFSTVQVNTSRVFSDLVLRRDGDLITGHERVRPRNRAFGFQGWTEKLPWTHRLVYKFSFSGDVWWSRLAYRVWLRGRRNLVS